MTTTDTPEPKPRKPYAMTAKAIEQRRRAGRKSKGRKNPRGAAATRQRWALMLALLEAHKLSAGRTGTTDNAVTPARRSDAGEKANENDRTEKTDSVRKARESVL